MKKKVVDLSAIREDDERLRLAGQGKKTGDEVNDMLADLGDASVKTTSSKKDSKKS